MRPARQKILETVRRIKETNPCVECKIFYPYYMIQFDHVRGQKVDKINRMVYTSSYDTVMDEIAKCDIVCANCHHERTYKRQEANKNDGS